jgi:uncharacterized phage protein (TIGR02216 family)
LSAAVAPEQDAFPWDEVMAIGLGVLRLAPHDFWAMTPREFERAIGKRLPQAPTRRVLDDLMNAFPDRMENHG